MVMLLPKLTGGVYDKEQWLEEIMQLSGLNDPPAPLSLHDTIPMTFTDELELS